MKQIYKKIQIVAIVAGLLFAASLGGFAQTSVGINTKTPNPNAVLQMVSPGNNQGVLVPSLTSVQRTDKTFKAKLTANENGLLVFDNTDKLFYYWKDTAWLKIFTGDMPRLDQILAAGDSAKRRITKVSNPKDTFDAVNRFYVDSVKDRLYWKITYNGKYVDSSVSAINVSITDVYNKLKLPTQTGNKDKFLQTDGTSLTWTAIPQCTPFPLENTLAEGNTGSNKHQIKGILNPTDPQDVSTKYYVDTTIQNIGKGGRVNLASGKILIGDAVGKAQPQSVTGDVVIDKDGKAEIQSGVVTSTEIANGTIATSDIASTGNTKVLITDATGVVDWIDQSALAKSIAVDNSTIDINASNQLEVKNAGIITAKIADNAITNAKMDDNAIGSAEIIDNSITTGDIKSTGNSKVLTTDATGSVSWIDKSALAKDIAVDNTSIDINTSNQLEVKDGGVTSAKIANKNVTLAKIQDGAASDQFMTTNATNNAQWQSKNTIPVSGFAAAMAPVDMGTQNIQNVADPIFPQDAVTKKYANKQIDSVKSDLKTIHDTLKIVKTDLKTVHDTLNIIKKDLTTIHDTLQIVKTDLKTVHDTLNIIKKDLTTIHDTLQIVKTDLKTVHDTLNIIKKDLTTIHDTLQIVKTDLKTVHDTLNIIKKDLTTIHDTLQIVKTDVKNVKDSLTLIKGKIDSVMIYGAGLPKQASNGGSLLATDGTNAYWFKGTSNGQVLTWNGTAWVAAATQGDMLKATYDTNDNGKVDNIDDGALTDKHFKGISTAGTSGEVLVSKGDGTFQWEGKFSGGMSNSLANANIWIGNGATASIAQARTIGGDVTLSNTGDVQIVSGAVTTTEIANGTIAAGDIATPGNLKVLTSNATGTVTWLDQSALSETINVDNTSIDINASKQLEVKNAGISNVKIASDAVTLSTQTTGNYVATITAGDGISGSASAEGATPTIAVNYDNATIDVVAATKKLEVKDAGISTAKIADNAITNAKMADDAIGSAEIIDNSITTGDIKSTGNTKVLTTDGTGVVSWIDQSALAKTIAVDNSTIDLNASNQLEVKSLGVGTSQLAASAVTSAKISDGAVDTVDIRAGQNTSVLTTNSAGKVIWIKQSELAKTIAVDNTTVGLNASNQLEVKTSGIGTTQLAAGAVTTAKIEALASGQFIIGTNGTTAGNTKVTMTGDVSMSNTGATTIGNNKVTTAAIADNNVTLAKIADGTAINQFITTPLSGTTFDPQWTSKASISLSGFGAAAADISLGGFKITDLATPASATDAVTKKYVDDIIPTTAFTKYNVPYWDGAKYANSTIWCSGDSLIVGTKTAPANAAAFNYNFEVKGTLKTDKIFHRSDSVFKKNVHTLGSALDHVKAMRGVSYEWKRAENPTENFAKGTQIGLIAQEVERVYPELVTTDNGGHKSVEYANLVAVLIEAIKEQQKLIEKQNAEIAALKLDNQKSQTELSKVADMQKQMADMQKQMASLVSAMQLYMPSAQVTK